MALEANASSATARPSRSNEDWVRDLRDEGEAGKAAQRDLRSIMVSCLGRALARRGVAEDLCEDFAQDALLRVREKLAAFRGEARFTTWALSIATRVAFDELRHKRWKDVSFDAVSAGAKLPLVFEPSSEADQERLLVRERILSCLRDVLVNELTEKQRAALVAELNGMPQSEIARQLGMKRNALYKLSHDARKRVKEGLERAGVSENDVSWVFE